MDRAEIIDTLYEMRNAFDILYNKDNDYARGVYNGVEFALGLLEDREGFYEIPRGE